MRSFLAFFAFFFLHEILIIPEIFEIFKIYPQVLPYLSGMILKLCLRIIVETHLWFVLVQGSFATETARLRQ